MPSGTHRPSPRQTIIYGKATAEGFPEALKELSARRVLLVTGNTFARPGGLAEKVRTALGGSLLETVTGIHAHSPREDVVRIARLMRDSGADTLVGLGGGSITDAVKAARLCVGNGVFEAPGMDRLRIGEDVKPPQLGFVMIPTTLSAGEVTPYAGVTDERGPRKEPYFHVSLAPEVVLLDPAMTLATPDRLWFSTGIRAVDHAVETWCSVNATPYSDGLSLKALDLLARALRRVKEAPDDLAARLDCQVGAWLSIQGFACGVDLGGSHGIGHALGGTAGMPHGETSCVMLPHVLRYNLQVNAARHQEVARTMGRPASPAADAVAELVAALGMPGRLRDAEVARELLPQVAAEAVHDHWVQTNPRPIDGVKGILALLEQAW